jgi:circadian clock protein KaiB
MPRRKPAFRGRIRRPAFARRGRAACAGSRVARAACGQQVAKSPTSHARPPSPGAGPRHPGANKELTLATYLLKLYVTGKTPRAEVAIANLRRICEEELHSEYELQIIDVLEQPQLAEDDKILATPTLIKRLPPPLRRVIGDLSDKEKVLLGLELRGGEASSTNTSESA